MRGVGLSVGSGVVATGHSSLVRFSLGVPCGQMPFPACGVSGPPSSNPAPTAGTSTVPFVSPPGAEPSNSMALPPHALHRYFRLPCTQRALPPHSLQMRFSLPCGQTPMPPHSLHRDFCLPCSHFALCRPLPSLVEGHAAPPTLPSASLGDVRSSVCGLKPLGPPRISGSHASSDGSGLIGFAAAEEEAQPHDSYATTRHSSSIADATLPRWQPTNVSIPDLEARCECTGAA